MADAYGGGEKYCCSAYTGYTGDIGDGAAGGPAQAGAKVEDGGDAKPSRPRLRESARALAAEARSVANSSVAVLA